MRSPLRLLLPLTVLAVLIVGFFSAIWFWGDDDWGPDRHTEVARVVTVDGVETGNTIVIERDGHRGGFFPFGLFLVPLVVIGFFALMRAIFWRPWHPGGPGGFGASRMYGGPYGGDDSRGTPPWFAEWHRREHARDAASTPHAPSSTSPVEPTPPATDAPDDPSR